MLSMALSTVRMFYDSEESKEGVRAFTYTAASTPFLNDICEAVASGAPRPTAFCSFLCAGAPIPPALIERAARELDLKVCSLWGMTESLSSTLTEPSRAAEKSSKTDGRALDGVEVRVVDFEGRPAPVGATGKLLVRGAQMFIVFYKRPDIETTRKVDSTPAISPTWTTRVTSASTGAPRMS
jgi:cyclohexanecarboxylate-CoA ligase